ncbi:MAG: DUF4169 family protein [Oceanicaulis sp.]
MTKPINLRQARKRRARAEKDKQADANRVTHGTPKAVRDLEAGRREALAKRVDGHRRDEPSDQT